MNDSHFIKSTNDISSTLSKAIGCLTRAERPPWTESCEDLEWKGRLVVQEFAALIRPVHPIPRMQDVFLCVQRRAATTKSHALRTSSETGHSALPTPGGGAIAFETESCSNVKQGCTGTKEGGAGGSPSMWARTVSSKASISTLDR